MIQFASVRCSEDAWQKRTKSARMVFRQVREMKEIMIATSNAHKVEEFTQMLAPLGYQVRSLLDLEEARRRRLGSYSTGPEGTPRS